MTIGVICAMEEELRALLAKLDDETEISVANQHYFKGTIEGVSVVLVESGIGKVQMGMTTAIMLEKFAPDVVINTGSAGGIGQGLQVGDVVLSNAVAYHDADATAFGYEMGQLPQQPQKFTADADVVADIARAAESVGLNTKTGLIVSGDQFIASDDAKKRILNIYPDALAAEMEGAAIGQVATQFNTPFVVIRAMSDTANGDAGQSFDEFIVDAGKRSAQMLLAYIHQLKEA